MFLRLITILLLTVIMPGIQLNSMGVTAENSDQAARKSRSMYPYNQALVKETVRTPNIHRRRSAPSGMMVIPSDEALRHDYYPENVEQALGKVRLQRKLNGESNDQPPQRANRAVIHPTENLNEMRMRDLEEIFRILARRDGMLLEQMLSLKSAIEKFYGIFEFMGIANLPRNQRDPAIRKVLERSFTVEAARQEREKRV